MHDGDWDPDPSAVHNLLKHVRDNSTLTIKFKKVSVQPRDPKATGYPLLYMTGHHEFHWTDLERAWLQRYLKAGGMLLADACCGRLAFDLAFQREIARVLPEQKLATIPLDHPLYHAHYDIGKVEYTPRVTEDFGATAPPACRESRSTDGSPSSTAGSTWATAGSSSRTPTPTATATRTRWPSAPTSSSRR